VGELLAAAGEAQHGVVAHWQLRRRGVSAREIEGLLGRGHLRPLYRGVYAVGHTVLSRKGRWKAAVLACGPGAVLSHRSAAEAWDLRWPADIDVELTRPRAFRPQGGLRCHRAVLRADETGEVDGIPVTSRFRTVLDLAAARPVREAELAIHELQRQETTDALSFDALLVRHPGHRGAAVLKRLRASKVPLSVPRNDFEEAFVAFVDDHGLPRPAINAPLALGDASYEIDALWRPQRLAVELDGRETHDTPDSFESDRKRDRDLLVAGYRTTRITWRQLRDERPRIAADLRALLGR
jgi:hypothetical protein